MTQQQVSAPSSEAMTALIAAQASNLPGDADFSGLRSAARERFSQTGLPHRRIEEWKYSDLRRVMPTDLALAPSVTSTDMDQQLANSRILKDVDRARVMFVNGEYKSELSDLGGLEGLVSIRSVADALAAGDFVLDDPEIAQKDIALALNTALVKDGVIIEIAEGAKVERPIEIRNVVAGDGLATVRNRVVIGKAASAMILESFVGDEGAHQINAAIDYRISDEADMQVTRLINDGSNGVHVGSTTVVLGAQAKFEHFTLSTGGKFTRSTSFVRFEGEFTDADMFGATCISGQQHSDISLVVDHAVPNCNSKEQYRTVLDDRAQGVFQGKIIVKPQAQKTDGQMMSQALLLSEDAGFYNKPELEIFADDVQCAHGATCGELDEDLLFYLRSRGIALDEAKKMLVMAFLAEAVENVSNETFVEVLEAYIADWLGLDH